MTGTTLRTMRYGLVGLAFSAVGLALAVHPSRAQGYDDQYVGPADDGVTITAPRSSRTGEYGAPIEWVSTHRVVRFYDLDLDSPRGAHELSNRISFAARTACEDLNQMYPVSADNSPDCYSMAVRRAKDDLVDSLGYAPAGW